MQIISRRMLRGLAVVGVGLLVASIHVNGGTGSAQGQKHVAQSLPVTHGGAQEAAAPATSEPGARLTVHKDPSDPTDVSDELKKVYKYIDDNFDAHVERLQEWVRIPSISNTVEGEPGVWQSAQFLKNLITKELGCTAEIHGPGIGEWGAPGHAVVYGRCDVGAEKTIIDYIQADAMPVWPDEEWPAPPFAGQIIEKPPFKRVLVGKAASNQKGKEMAQLNALISIKAATGTLPVNVIFLADHDEERAEIGIRKFIFDHPDFFKDADAVFGYAGAQRADGRGQIVGQAIGMVVFDLETSIPVQQRGGSAPLWLVEQPMWRHVKMLSTLFDENSELRKDIAQDVLPPSEEEEEFLRREVEMTGGEPSFEGLMRLRTAIRVTITGMWGGNMAPGYAGRIVPPVASSKIDIRYPPNVKGEEVVKKVRAHLDRQGYRDVKINLIGIYPWSWANADTEISRAIRRMYQQFGVPFNEPPKGDYIGTWTGAGPPYLFTRAPLKLPVGRGGLGYGWGAHFGPEYYVIEGDGEKIYGFAGAIKSAATVLYNYAGKNAPESENDR